MDSEKFQELVLKQLQVLTEGQVKLEVRVGNIETDVQHLVFGQDRMQKDIDGIKNELSYVWGDIKKIDNRLSAQEEEVVILKRLK